MVGSLLGYVSTPCPGFQPMNANFGLLPAPETGARGRERRRLMAERALDAARRFALTLGSGAAA
jgi:methylenetetrahydrofolate--tRNA-(uracil-5-)-methyltransferase